MIRQEMADLIAAYESAAYHLAHIRRGHSFNIQAAILSQRFYKKAKKLIEKKKEKWPDAQSKSI